MAADGCRGCVKTVMTVVATVMPALEMVSTLWQVQEKNDVTGILGTWRLGGCMLAEMAAGCEVSG